MVPERGDPTMMGIAVREDVAESGECVSDLSRTLIILNSLLDLVSIDQARQVVGYTCYDFAVTDKNLQSLPRAARGNCQNRKSPFD